MTFDTNDVTSLLQKATVSGALQVTYTSTNIFPASSVHTVTLIDRVGAEHPLKADAGCRNTVFHARAQTGAEYVRGLANLGVRWFRIELLNETPEQTVQVLTKYRALLRGELAPSQLGQDLKLINRLGVGRGPE